MGFLPEFPPFFEIISFFLPFLIKSGGDKSVKIRIIYICMYTEGDIGLAAVDSIAKGVSLYVCKNFAYA